MSMPIETRVIEYKRNPVTSDLPVTIEWKGVRMMRAHSLRSSVKQIARMAQSLDVVKINMIGDMSSGKSTLAACVAHLIHKISEEEYKIPFAVRVFNKNDLLDFQATLEKLSPANYILIFDDVAWLTGSASKHQIDVVKQSLSVIRHIPGGEGCKIITIMCFQYSLSLDKFMRSCNFSYFTTVGSSELDNMTKIVGIKYLGKLLNFRRLYTSATTRGEFKFNLGRTGKRFVYSWRNPFQPNLFHDGNSLRVVVSPTKEFIDKFCSVCANSKEVLMKGDVNVKDFAEDITRKFGAGTARSAIRLKMHLNGMAVWPKRFQQCLRYIDLYMGNKNFNFQELMTYFNFKNETTQLHQKLPDEILNEPVPDITLS